MSTELWMRVSDVRAVIHGVAELYPGQRSDPLRSLERAIISVSGSRGKSSPEPTLDDVERAKLRREMALAITLQIVAARAGNEIDLGDVPDCALKMADTLIAGVTQ